MPSLKQIRATVFDRVNTHWTSAFPDVKMYYDNAFPQNAEVDKLSEYAMCTIEFNGGSQINVSPDPGHRYRGRVLFVAACREGTGSSKVLDYLDSLGNAMKFANFGGIVTQAPQPGKPVTFDGWFSYDLSVQFFADSNN